MVGFEACSIRDCLRRMNLLRLWHSRQFERGNRPTEAYRFRVSKIDFYLNLPNCEQVVLDFTGIRSANSSFVNALITRLFEQHGVDALGKLIFRGCLPTIQVLVQSAVDLGMTKHAERVA